MENLHKLITNLSGYELSSKEIEILKLGLGHGVATHPVESEMIVILEDIWDQTKNVQVIKNDLSKQWIKTAVHAFTCNYIDIDEKQLTDWNKFKHINKDLTILRLNTLQNYVNKLFSCGEINKEQKKLMRPKAVHIGRAYGLPKIHKPFQHLLKFWSIINTKNTPYHSIGKFLTSILNTLGQTDYVVKDSFEAAANINLISFGNISDKLLYITNIVK